MTFETRKRNARKYDMHVGFEEPILDWRVLFIAGNETNTKKTMRDLLSIPAQERTHIKVPVLAANLEETKKMHLGTFIIMYLVTRQM
ncbi:hypothetical protein F3K44_31440 [Bacillus megaterium]|nr:hypothetical protein [Priestia megaterium]